MSDKFILDGHKAVPHSRKNVALVAAIARRGITGQQLAEICELHPMTISGLVNRKQWPRLKTAQAIAHALGMSVADLFLSEEGAL